jgi:SAM-dependent methyltransferase
MDLSEMPGALLRRHPWEVARARFFGRVLRDAGLLGAARRVLDVGAGDGYLAGTLLAELPAGSSAVCFDAHYSDEDLRRFGEGSSPGLSFSRERPAGRFDLILLLDVVEHVADDRGFLGAFVTDSLAPGGVVLVSVPAWPALFSRHDEALKHYRRYRPAACRALMAEVGLTIRRSGGLFHSLLVPRALAVVGERLLTSLGRRPAVPSNLGDWRGGRAISTAVGGGLAADTFLSRLLARLGPSVPALPGLSFWALCEAASGDGAAGPEARAA